MYLIAIDLGSSYIKSFLFDLDKRIVLREDREPAPQRTPHVNHRIFEVAAEEVFSVVERIIHNYCQECGGVEGVLFSTQMHGCVYSDPDFSKDVYISWQDTRCLDLMPQGNNSYMEQMSTMFSAEDMLNTGVVIKPALALCNLYTLLYQRNFQIGSKAELYTLGSYLISRLSGRNVCHITNAAPMGFVDITRGVWHGDILNKAGMSGIKLPSIISGFSACAEGRVGEYSFQVYPDFGDQQISVLGTLARDNDLVINIATAAQVILVKKGFRPGPYELRPFFDGSYCRVISRMPAGRNFDVFIDFICEIGKTIFGVHSEREDVWQHIQQHFTLGNTDGLTADIGTYELPDKLADGSIEHINHHNLTLSNLFTALLHNMGSVYAHYIHQICGDEEQLGNIIFGGGAAMNTPAIMLAIENAIGIKATPNKNRSEVQIGMLRAALMCSGVCSSLDETLEGLD